MKLYEQAIQTYPHDGDFYLNLSIHYARDKKQFDKAEELIKKAIELDPKRYDFQWEHAVILIDQNKIDSAKTVLTQAKKLMKTEDQVKEFDSVMKQIDDNLQQASAGKK